MDSNGGASPGPQDHDMNESLGDLNEFLMRDVHVMTSLIAPFFFTWIDWPICVSVLFC